MKGSIGSQNAPIRILRLLALLVSLSTVFGCSAIIAYSKGTSYMQDEKYALAIEEYNKVLSAGPPPIVKSSTLNNIGTIYAYLDNYEKSNEYFLKSIAAYPQRGYLGYINLAWINLINGRIKKANEYAVKALDLVNNPNYEREEKRSGFEINAMKRYVIGTYDAIRIRMSFDNLNEAFQLKNYGKAVEIANQLLNQEYHVELGIDVVNKTISVITKGSIADLNNLLKGDLILKIDGSKINNVADFYNTSTKYFDKFGNVMNMEIKRKNRTINMQVRLLYPEIDKAKLILQECRRQIAMGNKGYDPNAKDTQKPTILVLEPKVKRGLKIVEKKKMVNFVILASDNVEVKDLFVNNTRGVALEPTDLEKTFLIGNVKKYHINLPLLDKNSKFLIKAIDTSDNIATQEFEVEFLEKASIASDFGTLYERSIAVVIGINKYKFWAGLEFAVNDAKAMKNKLNEMGFDKIIELYDDDATRANITRTLGDILPNLLGSDDRLLIFFAGHGATEELPDGSKDGYIVPIDGDRDNYMGTSISMPSINNMINKYRAKHKLLLFDSCYSGLGLKRAGGLKKVSGFIKKISQEPAALIITSGGQNEQAAEEKGHGVFTRQLLLALDGKADLDNDGFILGSEIGLFVRRAVSEKTENKQNPQFGWLSGEGDFIFER